MIIIMQQQHIEKETYQNHDGHFSNEQHIIPLVTWEKKPLNSKPKCHILIPNSKPKPCLLKL